MLFEVKCRAMTPLTVVLGLVVVGCSSHELTNDTAQSLLDEKLGANQATVVAIRNTGEADAIAKVQLSGSREDIEVNVTFELFDTGWRPGNVEMGEQTFPLTELLDQVGAGVQRRTMAFMRELATANGTLRFDTGRYAATLQELWTDGYVFDRPLDGWGNAFEYTRGDDDTYTITSLGSDGARGPAPPRSWLDAPFEPDIVLRDGQFVQRPTGR